MRVKNEVNLSELFLASGGSSGGGDCNIPILNSPPANPELGEQWFSSTDGTYLYGAEWVAIGGAVVVVGALVVVALMIRTGQNCLDD